MKYKRKYKKVSVKRFHKVPLLFTLTLVLVIVLTITGYLVFERVSLKNSLSNLNIVDSYELSGFNLKFNDKSINLKNPLIKIRKYDSSTNKFHGSSITELISVLNTSSLYLSKSANYLVYEVMDSKFTNFNSDKLKVRFSELDDGYLLEVNNKTDKSYYISYDSDYNVDIVDENSSNLSNVIQIKSGLNQIKLPSNLDLNLLCKELVTKLG